VHKNLVFTKPTYHFPEYRSLKILPPLFSSILVHEKPKCWTA